MDWRRSLQTKAPQNRLSHGAFVETALPRSLLIQVETYLLRSGLWKRAEEAVLPTVENSVCTHNPANDGDISTVKAAKVVRPRAASCAGLGN